MSDTSFPYKSIQYPDLTSSGYGKGVNEMFNNINSNFEKLANYDFHKGDDGKSVKNVTISLEGYVPFKVSTNPFKVSTNPLEENEKILNNIYTELCYFGLLYSTGNAGSITDKFAYTDMGIGKITLVVTDLNDVEKSNIVELYKNYVITENADPTEGRDGGLKDLLKHHILYIFPYMYFDKNIYNDANSNMKNMVDYSGIYQYAYELDYAQYELERRWFLKGIFEPAGSFPTIYYDDNVKSFCWKFGEIETGVPAQGLPGKNGESGMFALVKIDENADLTKNVNPVKISSIYLNGEYKKLDGIEDLYKYNGVNCIAVPPGSSVKYYWLTQMVKNGNEYYVNIGDNNKIAFDTNILTFYDWMKSINTKTNENGIDSWSKVKGLFVPYDDANTKAHMLYGKWEQKGDNWDDKRNELHLSPVNLDNGQPSDNNDNSVSFVVDYDTTIDGTLNVANISNGENPVSIKALNVIGNTTIYGTLNVESDTTLGGTLNVDVITPSNDSLVVNGNLSCNEINGNLKIEKRVISYEKLNISGVLYKIGNIINVQLKMILASFDDYFYGLNGGIVETLISEGGVVLKEEEIDGIPSIIDGINTQEDWCYVPYIYPPYKSGETPNMSRNDGYYCGAVFKSYISKGALKLELKNMFSDGYNPNILLCYQEYSEFNDGNMPPVIHLSFTLHSI